MPNTQNNQSGSQNPRNQNQERDSEGRFESNILILVAFSTTNGSSYNISHHDNKKNCRIAAPYRGGSQVAIWPYGENGRSHRHAYRARFRAAGVLKELTAKMANGEN